MQKNFTLLMVMLLCGALTLGCQQKDEGAAPAGDSGDAGGETAPEDEGSGTSSLDTETTTQVVFCGTCGHEKGSESCCADDCETCECGMHKGSALCCKLSEDMAGKDMCGTCGHVAASEACCADDCEKCEKCGLHKDSALCCKLVDA